MLTCRNGFPFPRIASSTATLTWTKAPRACQLNRTEGPSSGDKGLPLLAGDIARVFFVNGYVRLWEEGCHQSPPVCKSIRGLSGLVKTDLGHRTRLNQPSQSAQSGKSIASTETYNINEQSHIRKPNSCPSAQSQNVPLSLCP